jgi:hypothetical protein
VLCIKGELKVFKLKGGWVVEKKQICFMCLQTKLKLKEPQKQNKYLGENKKIW